MRELLPVALEMLSDPSWNSWHNTRSQAIKSPYFKTTGLMRSALAQPDVEPHSLLFFTHVPKENFIILQRRDLHLKAIFRILFFNKIEVFPESILDSSFI